MTQPNDIISALVAEHAQNALAEEERERQEAEALAARKAEFTPRVKELIISVGALTAEEVAALFDGCECSIDDSDGPIIVQLLSTTLPGIRASAEPARTDEPCFRLALALGNRYTSFDAFDARHRPVLLAIIAEAYQLASETSRRAEFAERMRSQS